MGKISKPKGLKGEVWVELFNKNDSILSSNMAVWILVQEGKFLCKYIEFIKFFSSKSLIKFKDCSSRNDVEGYIGFNFSISRSLFPALNDKEVYLADLQGFMVYDEFKVEIGKVNDTISLPNQNIIVVNSKDGEVMIPFVDAHIKFFDKKEKTIIVKSIEGLVF